MYSAVGALPVLRSAPDFRRRHHGRALPGTGRPYGSRLRESVRGTGEYFAGTEGLGEYFASAAGMGEYFSGVGATAEPVTDGDVDWKSYAIGAVVGLAVGYFIFRK